jgi:hypothetical protein
MTLPREKPVPSSSSEALARSCWILSNGTQRSPGASAARVLDKLAPEPLKRSTEFAKFRLWAVRVLLGSGLRSNWDLANDRDGYSLAYHLCNLCNSFPPDLLREALRAHGLAILDDPSKRSPLAWIFRDDNHHALEVLLEFDLPLDILVDVEDSGDARVPLLDAAIHGNADECFADLLRAGAPLNDDTIGLALNSGHLDLVARMPPARIAAVPRALRKLLVWPLFHVESDPELAKLVAALIEEGYVPDQEDFVALAGKAGSDAHPAFPQACAVLLEAGHRPSPGFMSHDPSMHALLLACRARDLANDLVRAAPSSDDAGASARPQT